MLPLCILLVCLQGLYAPGHRRGAGMRSSRAGERCMWGRCSKGGVDAGKGVSCWKGREDGKVERNFFLVDPSSDEAQRQQGSQCRIQLADSSQLSASCSLPAAKLCLPV